MRVVLLMGTKVKLEPRPHNCRRGAENSVLGFLIATAKKEIPVARFTESMR